jgi:hypothetical protein
VDTVLKDKWRERQTPAGSLIPNNASQDPPAKRGAILPKPRVQGKASSDSSPTRAILGPLDTLVDIGVPAEKEVIQ